MRVPWTAMRSNQSILKLINPEYALEGHYIDTEPPRKPLVTSLSLILLCDSCMYEIKIFFSFKKKKKGVNFINSFSLNHGLLILTSLFPIIFIGTCVINNTEFCTI